MKYSGIIPIFKAIMDEIDTDQIDIIDSVVKFATRKYNREEMMKIMSIICSQLGVESNDIIHTIIENDDFSGML
jgi:hypothetical protein